MPKKANGAIERPSPSPPPSGLVAAAGAASCTSRFGTVVAVEVDGAVADGSGVDGTSKEPEPESNDENPPLDVPLSNAVESVLVLSDDVVVDPPLLCSA